MPLVLLRKRYSKKQGIYIKIKRIKKHIAVFICYRSSLELNNWIFVEMYIQEIL